LLAAAAECEFLGVVTNSAARRNAFAAEAALIMRTGIEGARRTLSQVGRFEPAGADGYWSLGP
jgi:hypothetical protein